MNLTTPTTGITDEGFGCRCCQGFQEELALSSVPISPRLTDEETSTSVPMRTGTGLAAMEHYRIVILLDLLRVLTFEHAGSLRI